MGRDSWEGAGAGTRVLCEGGQNGVQIPVDIYQLCDSLNLPGADTINCQPDSHFSSHPGERNPAPPPGGNALSPRASVPPASLAAWGGQGDALSLLIPKGR